MDRLSNTHVASLKGRAQLPSYDRGGVETGIVHLGTGAFHRAHQGVFTEDCLERGDLRWGILGASLRSAGVAEQLNPQDGLYSCLVRDGSTTSPRVIGACKGVVVAPQNPTALIAQMAKPSVHIISLTVTEKGYHLDPATGQLNVHDEAVISDVDSLEAPKTALGFIVAALDERKSNGGAGLTCLSCDNLPDNGERLKEGVLTLAKRRDPALCDWIEENAAFPSTMVDRIVPATTPYDIEKYAAEMGVVDHGLVKTEPFNQWVIENRFAGPRPDWEAVGAQITDDVRPWELAKLRLLNGAHSGLAYLGALAGHEYVHQAVCVPAFEDFVDRIHDEATATLSPPKGLDVRAYRNQLKARFANASLMHKTRQIAMDGSQKLPQRLLLTMRQRLNRGQSIDALALAVAGWMRWQSGQDEVGNSFVVDDPLASKTAAVYATTSDPQEIARGLISLDAVFGEDLIHNNAFVEATAGALSRLIAQGAAACVADLSKLEVAV